MLSREEGSCSGTGEQIIDGRSRRSHGRSGHPGIVRMSSATGPVEEASRSVAHREAAPVLAKGRVARPSAIAKTLLSQTSRGGGGEVSEGWWFMRNPPDCRAHSGSVVCLTGPVQPCLRPQRVCSRGVCGGHVYNVPANEKTRQIGALKTCRRNYPALAAGVLALRRCRFRRLQCRSGPAPARPFFPAAARKTGNAQQQIGLVDGFGNKIVGASLNSAIHVAGLIERRVIIIIAMSVWPGRRRSRLHTSKPLMRGIITSSRIRSGRHDATGWIVCSPSLAVRLRIRSR